MATNLTRRDLFKRSAMATAAAAAVPGLGAMLEACGASGGSSNSSRSGIKIAVVTHGQASDSFWSVVKNGIVQGATDMGVSYTYNAPTTYDMVKMSQLIDAAVATRPAGLVVSIPDATALSASIKAAVAAGIPVVSVNSGSDVYRSLGVLAHVGQTEEIAGQAGGVALGKAGVTNALCINQEQGNTALALRYKGFQEGLGANGGGAATELVVDLNNPADAAQKIESAVQRSSYNGILALGPTAAAPAMTALTTLNKLGSVKLGTFDLSTTVLTAIENGNMLFAIDQQQYLQGYLPIVFLTLYKLYLLMPGGGQPVLTGPALVEKNTASQVYNLSKESTR